MKKIAPIGLLALGGGGDKLPAYSEVDAGKALMVSELGGLEWKQPESKLYEHSFVFNGVGSKYSFALISKKSTAYTNDELIAEIGNRSISASGTIDYSTNGYIIYEIFVSGTSVKVRGARIADAATSREWTFDITNQYAHEYIREI